MKIVFVLVTLAGLLAETASAQNVRPIRIGSGASVAALPAGRRSSGVLSGNSYALPRITAKPVYPVLVPDSGVWSGYVPENLAAVHASMVRAPSLSSQAQPATPGQTAAKSQFSGRAAARDLQIQNDRYDVRYSNTEVRKVQVELHRLGFYHGPADGILGSSTQNAVLAYQVGRSQPATGVISTQLLHSLGIVSPAGSH